MTVAMARRRAVAALRDAGIDTAEIDARRLMAAALEMSEAQVLARGEANLTDHQAAALRRVVERRLRHEPVSRILGQQEFFGRRFVLTPDTLDPRPDTETVIVAVLDILRENAWPEQPLRIVDVGTGTGCLLLTLLCELPTATGVGIDLSRAALEVARLNAVALGVAPRTSWQVSDVLENCTGKFHLLVSNPPYVRSEQVAELEPEVSRFDPRLALDGGPDGLAVYRRLAARALDVVPAGWIVLEVGYDQADTVADLFMRVPSSSRVAEVRFYADVSGTRRCVAVRTRD